MSRVYLDHLATTALDPDAREAMLAALSEPGNPGSPHEEGRRAKDRLEEARTRVARAWGCRPREVVFAASGTVAAQLGVLGAARARRTVSNRVVLSALEHPAVGDAGDRLETEGHEVVRVPPERNGRVSAGRFLEAVSGAAGVAALMQANHETGVVQPVAEIASELRDANVPFLVDACLAPGRLPAGHGHVDAPLVALSGHKFGGPRGFGILIVERGTAIEPLWVGGLQEERLHPGTEAVASAMGTAVALERALREQADRSRRYARTLGALLATLDDLEDWSCIGPDTARLPGVVTLEIPGVEGEAAMINLDIEGVAVSTGSACALGGTEPAAALHAMGLSRRRASCTLRISVGEGNSDEEAVRAGHALAAISRRLRRLARS